MKLRHRADWRTLVWVAAMFSTLVVQYANPDLVRWLWPLSCYLGLTAGVIAHNHNHCPTFESKRVNAFFAGVLSLFNGYPTFAWVPTHNLNHHKYVNRAGDATITWRYTKKHNWFVASTYFFVSAYWQSEPIKDYIRKARERNPRLFRNIVLQYIAWGGNAIGLLTFAVARYGWSVGLYLFIGATLIPALFALWGVIFFNYIQHVHTDPWSEHNHSRSFTGGGTNFFLFNNGYHGVHHENAGLHWSQLPQAHALVADKIDPRLCQSNFPLWLIKTYLLAPFIPSFGTVQVGRAAYDDPTAPVAVATAEVSAEEAGTNAVMV